MKIRYTNSIEDAVAFSKHHHQTSPTIRRTRLISRWICTLSVFLLGAAWSLKLRSEFWLLRSTLFATVCFFASPYLFSRFVARGARRVYSEGSNKGFFGDHELELVPEGIVERTQVGEQRCTWEGLEKIETDGDRTFLYLGSTQAHIVPRGSVKEGEYESFVRAVREQWIAHCAQQSDPADADKPHR